MNIEKKVTLVYEVKVDPSVARNSAEVARETERAAKAQEHLNAAMRSAPKSTPTGGGSGGISGLGGTSWAPPGSPAWPSMMPGMSANVPSGSMNMQAMAANAYRAPGAAMNMQALGGAAYIPPSLMRAQFAGSPDWANQTMNEAPKNPGMMAGLGARAYGMGAAALRYGVPAIAAVRTASAVASAVHDSDLVGYQGGTGGEQMRSLANGTWLTRQGLGIVDEFRGRSQGMARVEYDESIRKLAREKQEEQRLFASSVQLGRIDLESRRDVLNRDARTARISPVDRGTVAGERDYGRQLQLLPARQGEIEADRELNMGQERLDRQLRMRDQLRGRVGRLEFQGGQLSGAADATGGADRLNLLRQSIGKSTELESAKKELRELEQKIESSRGDVVKLKAEAGQAKIGVMQGQLSILEQRESKATNQAQKYGGMTDFEFDVGYNALATAKQYGVRSLTPDQRGAAQSFEPELYGKLAENEYERSGRFQKLRDLSPAAVEDSPKDARKQLDKERNDLADAVRNLKKDTANAAADSLLGKDFIGAMRSMMASEVATAIKKLKEEIEAGNAKN